MTIVLASYDEALRYALRPPPPCPPATMLSWDEGQRFLRRRPKPPLAPLEGHPNSRALCLCSHSGNDHSHILYDSPCLECECWGFTFWRLADSQQMATFYTHVGQAIGMGLINSEHLRLVPE